MTGDFKSELDAARAMPDSGAGLHALAALAERDLSYVQTIQLDKALLTVRGDAPGGFVRVGLAIAGTTTVTQLLPAIRVAGLRRKLLIDATALGFGQYRQEILAERSPLAEADVDLLLLTLSPHELLSGISLSATRPEADAAVAAAVDDLRGLWRLAKQRFGVDVVQQSFLDAAAPLFGNHEQLVPGAPGRLLTCLNAGVAAAAAEDGVLVLDLAGAAARDGLEAWFDDRHWLQGKMEIAPAAAPRYAELLARLIGAQYGRSRKCLVLDLDNTLWGGVIGDAGLGGIVLGEGSAAGEAHLALQRYAARLKERGVILAICSKNEAAIVDEAFERHPEMLLRRGDIAAFAVNWRDKAQNLREIAARLNVGLDSLVFVDDNPVERARIRASLPMVAVPELGDDPAYYVREVASGGYFESVTLADEDRQRADQYAANAERDALRSTSQSMDDFLRGLDMRVSFGPITSLELPRAVQLINKTNQFNTTTRRMSTEQVAAWAADARNTTLQFRLVDRFGDNGLVSVMLLSGGPGRADRPDRLDIENWVMSCRVFGRQLEHEALNVAVETARARGVRRIVADFVPTEKNAVIKDLFATLGFLREETEAPAGDATRWVLDVAAYEPHSTHISREEKR